MRQLLILYSHLMNDGYMTRLALKNEHQKDMYHNEIGLSSKSRHHISL
jgi:hypothetical protein